MMTVCRESIEKDLHSDRIQQNSSSKMLLQGHSDKKAGFDEAKYWFVWFYPTRRLTWAMNACRVAGNWVFSGIRWLNPLDSSDRILLEANFDSLLRSFPTIEPACDRPAFLQAILDVSAAWDRHTAVPRGGDGRNSLAERHPPLWLLAPPAGVTAAIIPPSSDTAADSPSQSLSSARAGAATDCFFESPATALTLALAPSADTARPCTDRPEWPAALFPQDDASASAASARIKSEQGPLRDKSESWAAGDSDWPPRGNLNPGEALDEALLGPLGRLDEDYCKVSDCGSCSAAACGDTRMNFMD
jgi:hypothetical protein